MAQGTVKWFNGDKGYITPGIPQHGAGRYPARPLERCASLCGHGRVEPYEPRRVCLIEFSDAFP